MNGRTSRPYQQGQLDGLCGPYSVVNAIHYLRGPLTESEAMALLLSVLQQLRIHYDPVNRVVDGVGIMEMQGLMRAVCRDYAIHAKRSRARKSNRGRRALWLEIAGFLRETGGIVLIDFEGADYGHWTLIRAISDRTLTLFDSSGRRYLHRRNCAVAGERRSRPYTFLPTTAYFLSSVAREGAR